MLSHCNSSLVTTPNRAKCVPIDKMWTSPHEVQQILVISSTHAESSWWLRVLRLEWEGNLRIQAKERSQLMPFFEPIPEQQVRIGMKNLRCSTALEFSPRLRHLKRMYWKLSCIEGKNNSEQKNYLLEGCQLLSLKYPLIVFHWPEAELQLAYTGTARQKHKLT